MKTQPGISLANLPLAPAPPRLLLGILKDREHAGLTELIARLALRGPYHLIAGGEWLPDQDSLRRSVRRHTPAVEETLDRLRLGRPATCLQLLDQLRGAGLQDQPILVLDFLHFFYDPDVELALRARVLEQCCQCAQHLAESKPVIALVQHLRVEEYELFLPRLACLADDVLEIQPEPARPAWQPALWGEA